MLEYDQIAEWFTETRNPKVGVPEIAGLIAELPSGARVLDLGCGDGVPISQCLLEAGLEVEALDSSRAMIERYRARFPENPARCASVLEGRFAPGSFDAAVAWGVLFHMAEPDQVAAMERVASWLRPGGRFLFTSGDVEGSVESEMNGVRFRYVSLGVDRYRSVLLDCGMRLDRQWTDAWKNTVYLATKQAGERW